MHKIAMIIALAILSGCYGFNIEVWDNSGKPSQGDCPDSDYDNGGNVTPQPGLCKMGTGGLISFGHTF